MSFEVLGKCSDIGVVCSRSINGHFFCVCVCVCVCVCGWVCVYLCLRASVVVGVTSLLFHNVYEGGTQGKCTFFYIHYSEINECYCI